MKISKHQSLLFHHFKGEQINVSKDHLNISPGVKMYELQHPPDDEMFILSNSILILWKKTTH